MLKYKGFTLDKFQEESIESIENGHSVVVSAATGTGKTLIADYIIDKYIKKQRRVIYTAPIKALSGQKYRDFVKEYGKDKIGLMTGDIVINPDALIIIMTTEIYRNMLITNDPLIEFISYVIFDEVHFINDFERGTIWEESIIFSPEHIRFLCLSATIPNKEEFAEWIRTIKKHKVDVVENVKRAVPLTHHYYDEELGLSTIENLMKSKKELKSKFRKNKNKKQKDRFKPPIHLDLIDILQHNKWLPCIFFNFSRKACEVKAKELHKQFDFLNSEDRQTIVKKINEIIPNNLKTLKSFQLLRRTLTKGIAFHHAGLLPKFKELVEVLFGLGIIQVLYATETFAVGINMPAKTVCFAGLIKYDGISTRYLNSKEYFQLAGRAGRRGIDKLGNAISIVDKYTEDLEKIRRFTTKDIDPIVSRFKLSINTVLNMIYYHDDQKIKTILKSNFDYFLNIKKGRKTNILNSYNNRLRLLKKLNFITDNNKLTNKGEFSRHIYSNEILIGELFNNDLILGLTEKELIKLIGVIAYEAKRSNRFKLPKNYKNHKKILNKIEKIDYAIKNINPTHLAWIDLIVDRWLLNYNIEDILKCCNLQEGDIIRFFRQIIDYARQIRKANSHNSLDQKLTDGINMINKGVIDVEF